LIAAAEPFADPQLIWTAAADLGIGIDSLGPAVLSGLCEVGTTVRLGHPLVRSAVYHSAGDKDGRLAHLALARATGVAVDPERHAWHLARAASGPDEAAATGLAGAAERLLARGDPAAAAALLREAVGLTDRADLRAEWSLGVARSDPDPWLGHPWEGCRGREDAL